MTANAVTPEYNSFFAPPALRSLPLAPVIGNHDIANSSNSIAQFRYFFNRPNDQSAGSQNQNEYGNYFYLYNNILFVALNTSAYPTSQNGADTYITRFRNTIQAAKAKHPNYDWLIVQHHKSTASVAEHAADTDIQYFVMAGFETLMSTENVDFVLAGHDHVYARSYPLQGMGNGLVSLPDKTTTTPVTASGGSPVSEARVTAITGKPIYLTFCSSSGQKYYQVPADPYSDFSGGMVATATYPYLGADISGNATLAGGNTYRQGNNLPVSNAAFVQPYIPSYCVVDVNGREIKFSTYPIATLSGNDKIAYSFKDDVPFDKVTVTK